MVVVVVVTLPSGLTVVVALPVAGGVGVNCAGDRATPASSKVAATTGGKRRGFIVRESAGGAALGGCVPAAGRPPPCRTASPG